MLIGLYLKLARKNLLKNKVHTLINVLGLALGLGCSMIIYQFVRYHLSFDSYHPNAKSIYRVVTDLHLPDGSTEYDSGTPLTLIDNLRSASSVVIDGAVALTGKSLTVSTYDNDSSSGKQPFFEDRNVTFTDGHWFRIFESHWLAGDKEDALNDPNSVVLTETEAKKYFGSAGDALGKTLELENRFPAVVKGVVEDFPSNTDNKADIFVSLSAYKRIYPEKDSVLRSGWDVTNSTTWTYLLLRENAHVRQIDELLKNLTKKHLGDIAQYYRFHLEPLKDIHFDMRYGGTIRRSMVTSLAIIGLLILVIACINFINLSTAQVAKRSREIGTMKVFGSRPSDIFWQFIIETAMLTLMAAVLASLWTLLFLPLLNNWLQIHLVLTDGGLLRAFLGLIIFVIFASGFYPSMVLSRFTPLNAIKEKTSSRSLIRNWGLKTLVIGQNSVAQFLIVCAVIITLQVQYLNNTEFGFKKEGVILVPIPEDGTSSFSYLSSRLKERSDIKSVSFCYRPPSDDVMRGGEVKFDGHDWTDFPVRSSFGDAGYLRTFGLQLLAGRNLRDHDSTREAVVNLKLVHKLGFRDPDRVLGHQLVLGDLNEKTATIVGVVKDFQVRPLTFTMEPDLITPNEDSYQYMALRIASNNQTRTIGAIGEIWRDIYPKNVFKFQFLDDRIEALYQKEELLNKLVKVSTIVAIFISCLGLLGLISLTIVHRTKEMAIRKVIGASSFDVARLLMSDFFRLILAAMLIAFPITWFLMHKWLENFAYHIQIEWWFFASAGVAAFLIASGTIGYQVAKVVRANPARSLKGR